MKVKRSFTFLIILICLAACLFTCKPHGGEGETEYEYTDVVYSEDGNSVTIYLEGRVYAPRALTTDIAKMGCDYFEVTFLYNDNGTKKVVRGEWSAGKMANVSGIERAAAPGIDYGGIRSDPGIGTGSAILFAGKSDKTLMAIGRLTGVDGNGNTTVRQTRITDTTKSVTFTISAVNAGVKAVSTTTPVDGKAPARATGSSFLTNAENPDGGVSAINENNTTVILNSRVFGTDTTVAFPIFKLIPENKIEAVYKFTLAATGDYSIGAYANPTRGENNAIFISTPAFGNVIPGLPPVPLDRVPAQIERKLPRYTTYDSNGRPLDDYHKSVLMQDEKTVVVLTNDNVPNAPFDPDVGFTFFTEGTVSGTVFALVFSIPVYALQEYESYVGDVGVGIKSRWYIRPGYGPSLYDLDDGTSGMGGAVLIGTGDVNKTAVGERTIRIPTESENNGVNGLPNKWQYLAGTDIFDVTGLIVQLVSEGNNPEVFIQNINYNTLRFKVGKSDSNGRHPNWTYNAGQVWTLPASVAPHYVFPAEAYGLIEITVEYYDNERDRVYQTSFYVLVGNATRRFHSDFNILHIYSTTYQLPNGAYYTLPTGATPAIWNDTNYPSETVTQTVPGERLSIFLEKAVIRDRTTIIILHHKFNLDRNFTINASQTSFGNFMVIAADDDRTAGGNTPEDIIMGRASGGGGMYYIKHSGGSSAGLNAWYFGVWPFKGTPNSWTWPRFPYDTLSNTNYTKPFTVNTAGVMYITGGNPPTVADAYNPTTSFKLMQDDSNSPAPGGGMYNVKVNGALINVTNNDTDVAAGSARYPLLH
jgi:hypothetical protein